MSITMPIIDDRIELKFEDHIAHVSLARPDKMNALDAKMIIAIPKVGELILDNPEVRCVVLSGQGDNFCAGLDKSNFEAVLTNQSKDDSQPALISNLLERTNGIANQFQYVAWMWRELPMPVVAALDGMVLGGGLQIALGADMRIAHPDSTFSILEMKWGLIPDMSSTQIMRHMVRDDVIRELTYTARMFSAQEAKEWGFITHISDDPLAHANKLAKQIVMQNPDAVQAAKRVIDQSYYQTAAEGLLTESIEQDKVMGTPNQLEAIMSVMQKRAPNFRD